MSISSEQKQTFFSELSFLSEMSLERIGALKFSKVKSKWSGCSFLFDSLDYRVDQGFRLNIGKIRKMIIFGSLLTSFKASSILRGSDLAVVNIGSKIKPPNLVIVV